MDASVFVLPNATLLVNIYDDFAGEVEELENHPFVQIVGRIALCVYVIVIAFGIPANIYVLFRMRRLARNDMEKYVNGTGVGLLSMAAADLLALILITTQNLLLSMPPDANQVVSVVVCKALLFSTHTVTSVSIWSWLLMSTLRYLAVRHPMFHLRLWQMPCRAVGLIILFSSLTNMWLLIAVDYSLESGCVLHEKSPEEHFYRYFFLLECVWSFCIPVVMILYMDVMALIRQPHKFTTADSTPHTVAHHRSKTAKSALWKWLLIAFIDILLNTPENVHRLVRLVGATPSTEEDVEYHYAAQIIAQVLYFSQFAFNSVYLALFVFDKSTKPRALLTANHIHSDFSTCTAPTYVVRRLPSSQKEQRCCSEETMVMLPRPSSSIHLKVVVAHL